MSDKATFEVTKDNVNPCVARIYSCSPSSNLRDPHSLLEINRRASLTNKAASYICIHRSSLEIRGNPQGI